MSIPVAESGRGQTAGGAGPDRAAKAELGAAVLGFFVITLDASVGGERGRPDRQNRVRG